MHRVDTDGHLENMFFDGDASGAHKEATVVDAAWLNGVQETICKVIESQGRELKKGDYESLLVAIQTIVEGAIAPVREDLLKLKQKVGL